MRRREPAEPSPWGRRRLLAALVLTILTGLSLTVGLGVAVHDALSADSDDSSSQHRTLTVSSADPRNLLAARPMPTAPPEAARPSALTSTPIRQLALPAPTSQGPAQVATGFPHTPTGALAQLVAIDQATLQGGSVLRAQEIVTAWALPGGPNATTWSGVRALADMLTAAGLPSSGSPSLVVSATPQMGLIKGAVGPSFVVACVDFVVNAELDSARSVAVADCQRMVWTPAPDGATGAKGGRWVIGPGREPAQPPALWPGTEAARDAGYLVLRDE